MKRNIKNRRVCFYFPSQRGQRGVNTILILAFILTTVLMSSCKSKEVPGRRRTPRHCNTCTKWSYAPQVESMDTLAIPSISFKPMPEEEYLGAEELGMTCKQKPSI